MLAHAPSPLAMKLTVHPSEMTAGQPKSQTESRKAMDDTDDLSRLDDPAFLAERARVREAIMALTLRYQRLTEEFDRRATAKWKEEAR